MLPDIVRAAAEPMSQIDNLTVLSNDGASELVRNTTRTVTEASATVKGLTGLDVPALISNALGDAGARAGARPTNGGADGGADPAARPSRPPTRSPAASPPAKQPDSADEVDQALRRASETIDRATAAVPAASVASAPSGPRASAPAPAQSPTTPGPAPVARPGAGAPSRPQAITASTPLGEAATILADQLHNLPGIERYAGIQVGQLEQRGSRPMRAAWRVARERLGAQYGQMTVGELLTRFGPSSGRQN
jgi:flotillin